VRLASIEHLHVHRSVLKQTGDFLRRYGEHGAEGLVLWAGTIEGGIGSIDRVIFPEQNPIQDETGVGYFVTAQTLFKLSRYLEKEKLRLIAQVHSHPTDAYHSEADDRYAIVTESGGFSLVVPDFARAPMQFDTCAIYRLRGADWMELDDRQVSATFALT
jgi:proteasome lid subunit RPN8/RPN11